MSNVIFWFIVTNQDANISNDDRGYQYLDIEYHDCMEFSVDNWILQIDDVVCQDVSTLSNDAHHDSCGTAIHLDKEVAHFFACDLFFFHDDTDHEVGLATILWDMHL